MQKIDRKTLDALASLGATAGEVFDRLDALKEQFERDLETVMAELNEARAEACSLMEDQANDAESYHDEKSERWQEGDRGQAYADWKNTLREVADSLGEDIDPPSVEMPDRPEWIDRLQDPDFSEFEFYG